MKMILVGRFITGLVFWIAIAIGGFPIGGFPIAGFSIALAGEPNDDPAAENQTADRPSVTDSITQDDVLDWVDQLSSPSRAERDQAERALIQAGPTWFESLPKIADSMPIETRQRLSRVIEAYRREKKNNGPSTVKIEISLGSIKTLGDALETISRASGIEFEHPLPTSTAVAPLPGRLTFWHAVDYVLDQADLDVNLYVGGRETIVLVPRQKDRPSRVDAAAYAGVYRIEPTSVSATRALRTPALSGLSLSLSVSWMPGQTPVGLIVPVNEITGVLNDGQIIRPQQSSRSIDIATTSEVATADFFLPLQLPNSNAQTIESIAGKLSAFLPGPTHDFEIPLDQISSPVQQDDMSVAINRLRRDGPLHSVQIAVKLRLPHEAMESHRQWLVQNEAFVLMDDQTRRDHLGFEVFNQSSGGIVVSYLFDLDGVDSPSGTLVYRSPTSLSPDEVTFILNEIELP